MYGNTEKERGKNMDPGSVSIRIHWVRMTKNCKNLQLKKFDIFLIKNSYLLTIPRPP